MKVKSWSSPFELFICTSLFVLLTSSNTICHAVPPATTYLSSNSQIQKKAHLTTTIPLSERNLSNWWSAMQKNIRESEYYVTWQSQTLLTDGEAAWQAPNHSQNLRTYFTPKGVWMIPRGSKIPEWSWGLSLQEWGADSHLKAVAAPQVVPNKNRVEYQRGQTLTEWYVNDRRGLEQGFTLNKPPVGSKKGDQKDLVILRLALHGNLQGTINANNDNIDFFTLSGEYVLKYGHLHTFDATGRELPTSLALNKKSLDIMVETIGAIYPLTVDPLASSPSWIAESDQAGADFGYSVSTAGDVNGDGYDDVIVGAQYYDNGQTNEGRAYVYYGSTTGLSTTAAWTAESNQEGAGFGGSVSSAGDVNGDGYDDVIVGAWGYENGQIYEGRAYVYYGSTTGLSTTANWTKESDLPEARYGRSVSTAGDVNGDGYDDVIVGLNSGDYSNGVTDEGRAFVYHGSASGLSTTAAWTGKSDQVRCYYGYSVSTAGDVNGDGYDDVIVGACEYGNGQTHEGRAYVYHGSATGLGNTAVWITESNQAEAYYGISVSTAGDVNSDGYDDVIVGAQYYDNGQTNEGCAYVFYGSTTGLSVTADWTAESNVEYTTFGRSVSTAGDVNGDSYDDVIIGASGKAYAYHGSASGLSARADWIAETDQIGDSFGKRVSTSGDVNGDGYDDVIVGAWDYSNGQDEEGRVFVYYGDKDEPDIDSDGDGLSDTLEDSVPCLDPNDEDSDDDGIWDGIEDVNHNGFHDPGETDPCDWDSDDDDMSDGYEVDNNLDPFVDDAAGDRDGDGFSNIREYVAGTSADDNTDMPSFMSETEDFETGDFSQYPWLTSGDSLWSVNTTNPYGGSHAAQAGTITDNQSTSLEISRYTEAGDFSFWYAVDSEQNYDWLYFYLDGTLTGQWSGPVAYTQAIYSLTNGMHQFRWEYVKDKSDLGGSDTAWVDDVIFPGFVDSDDDGMPDGWEVDHDMDAFNDDAGGDADGDLFTNGMECIMGTNPRNPADYPVLNKGFDADMDVDGADLTRLVEGIVSGIVTPAEVQTFAEGFGR